MEAAGIDVDNKEKDLGYWFDLYQKGAISKEGYEKVKRKLIS